MVVEFEKRLVMEVERRRRRAVEIQEVLKLTDKLPKHGQLFHAPESGGE